MVSLPPGNTPEKLVRYIAAGHARPIVSCASHILFHSYLIVFLWHSLKNYAKILTELTQAKQTHA